MCGRGEGKRNRAIKNKAAMNIVEQVSLWGVGVVIFF